MASDQSDGGGKEVQTISMEDNPDEERGSDYRVFPDYTSPISPPGVVITSQGRHFIRLNILQL